VASDGEYSGIANATSSTYKVDAVDAGKFLKVSVTRAGYSGSVTNAAVRLAAAPGIEKATLLSLIGRLE